MISSAPRQPSMIRINITAETTGLPSYHFFFDFEITVSVFLIPCQFKMNYSSSFHHLRFLGYHFILHTRINLFINSLTDNITENNQGFLTLYKAASADCNHGIWRSLIRQSSYSRIRKYTFYNISSAKYMRNCNSHDA